MIKYIKIIISISALILPLCVAQAQDIENNKKETKIRKMFVGLGLKTHSFDYENESIGRLYGKSVGMNVLSGGYRFNQTFSLQAGYAFGKTNDVTGLQDQISDASSCGDFITHSYTEGTTEIEETFAGVVYVQKSKATKIAAPRYGLAIRDITYNYQRDYRDDGSNECGTRNFVNDENHVVDLTGIELSVGVELGSGGLCGGSGIFNILGVSCEENKNLKFNITYSETVFLEKKSDTVDINTKGIENLSNFSIGFLYYF